MTASVCFPCPACGSSVTTSLAGVASARCGPCGRETPLAAGAFAGGEGRALRACALCAGDHFYIQKDFNRRLGLWLVVASGAASLAIYAWSALWAMGFLAAVTLLDFVLFRLLPWVQVCYGCGAIHRGFARNPDHHPFDLHVFETYELKRERRSGA